MKKVAILGSTGSIGTQTLQVVASNPNKFCVSALVAYSNAQLLNQQAQIYKPKYVGLISKDGVDCLLEAVKDADVAVVATRGIVALDAVMYCISKGIDVALANKEVLVTAGGLVNQALKNSTSKLLPVDSEHSAIWQCLQNNACAPKKLVLTASGGAFWGKDLSQLKSVTAKDALKHPNWNMGAKITIDSATMMNKAFEVVEACHLFNVDVDSVEVVVHRQSIVHSMVQFADNSVLAQLSNPDMKLPIQYALTYPDRAECEVTQLDLTKIGSLTFEKPDENVFPCVSLGHKILKMHPLCATVLNAANDQAVEAFLQDKITFLQIYQTVIYMVDKFNQFVSKLPYTLDNIKKIDELIRVETKTYLENLVV